MPPRPPHSAFHSSQRTNHFLLIFSFYFLLFSAYNENTNIFLLFFTFYFFCLPNRLKFSLRQIFMMISSLNCWIHLHADFFFSFLFHFMMIVNRCPVKSIKVGCVLMFICFLLVSLLNMLKYFMLTSLYPLHFYFTFIIATTSNYR